MLKAERSECKSGEVKYKNWKGKSTQWEKKLGLQERLDRSSPGEFAVKNDEHNADRPGQPEGWQVYEPSQSTDVTDEWKVENENGEKNDRLDGNLVAQRSSRIGFLLWGKNLAENDAYQVGRKSGEWIYVKKTPGKKKIPAKNTTLDFGLGGTFEPVDFPQVLNSVEVNPQANAIAEVAEKHNQKVDDRNARNYQDAESGSILLVPESSEVRDRLSLSKIGLPFQDVQE